jgi:hypothetical protein
MTPRARVRRGPDPDDLIAGPRPDPRADSPAGRRLWARVLTTRLFTELERALMDPELVSLRHELVRVDQRIADLEERRQKGVPPGAAFDEIRNLVRDAQTRLALPADEAKSISRSDALTASQLLDDISTIAESQWAQERLWDATDKALELRRRIADTERKYEELHKLLIPAAQLGLVFDRLMEAVREAITDEHLQLRLMSALRARLDGDRRDEKHFKSPLPLPPGVRDAPTSVDRPPVTDDGFTPGDLETEVVVE